MAQSRPKASWAPAKFPHYMVIHSNFATHLLVPDIAFGHWQWWRPTHSVEASPTWEPSCLLLPHPAPWGGRSVHHDFLPPPPRTQGGQAVGMWPVLREGVGCVAPGSLAPEHGGGWELGGSNYSSSGTHTIGILGAECSAYLWYWERSEDEVLPANNSSSSVHEAVIALIAISMDNLKQFQELFKSMTTILKITLPLVQEKQHKLLKILQTSTST